jgi:hypothetical protein
MNTLLLPAYHHDLVLVITPDILDNNNTIVLL